MAFRISTVNDNGSRGKSVLVKDGKAVISSAKTAQLQCDLPEDVTIVAQETSDGLTIQAEGAALFVKGTKADGTVKIRGGADFEIKGIKFYITSQISKKITPRKKTYLSVFSLTVVWVLLLMMLIVPYALSAKIKSHEQKDRHALMDKCSYSLDGLRETMKSELSKLDSYTQAHRDIVSTLNEEIEQMAWAFRTGGNLMNQDKMIQLHKDINRYNNTIKDLRTTSAVKVTPLDSSSVLKAVLPDK